LTPTASAASLGHARLQAVARDSRFARYCEENALADAFVINTISWQFDFEVKSRF
jgi:hypothetical protein